jgi:PAS domain S-box-containing protein
MLSQSSTDARVLRVVAAVIAVVSLGRELAGGEPPDAARQVFAVRLVAGAIAGAIALACSPERSASSLRLLALALGLDGALAGIAVLWLNPAALWEQSLIVISMILGGAVFMPWSWRWQAGYACVVLLALTPVLAILETHEQLSNQTVARALVTLAAISAASVLGAGLGDRARQQVVASEARFRALFEHAHDGIAVLDQDGVIQEANPRLAELLGRPLPQVLGTRLRDFYAIHHAVTTGADGAPREHLADLSGELRSAARTLVRPDGSKVDVEIGFSRVAGPNGDVVQAMLRDRTEHRARERRQVQEQRLDSMARMAGALSHQFNNILGAILTHAAVLRDDVTKPDARAAADEVIEAARRGRLLTKELTSFTRPDQVTVKPTPPRQIIDAVVALARVTLPAEIGVKTEVPAGLPAMLADEDHVVHACLQLVLNARDAMVGRGGTLTIGAAEQLVPKLDPRWPAAALGRYVRLYVRDTGAGMDAETLERVLEPFFSTKPLYEGSGLGLSGVHAVVLAHKGALGIESTPGRGTTVHVLLPATDTVPAQPSARAAPAAPPPATATGTILIVDDEPVVRNSLRRALSRIGYQVLEAGDGPSALAALQAADPPVDLVILDLVLPGGGAAIYELMTAVRPGLKVLVSSGYTPDAEAMRGLGDRVQGFLPKPYEIAELRAAVAKALAPLP